MRHEEFSVAAQKRGGLCINPHDYLNCKTKLTWQCLEGHTWTAVWNNIKNGNWCPHCRLKSEALVRAFLEFVTGHVLPSAKPQWLRNCGGPKAYYQLDGLNAEAQLAFEYHGPQHYREVGAFHRDGANLPLQQARDAFVRKTCLENGVRLIEVPTLPSATIAEQIVHIRSHCERVLGPIADAKVAEFLQKPFGARTLDKLHAHAQAHGGLCLSPMFTGVRTKYEWQCEQGHRWAETWTHIQEGRWCPTCGGRYGPTMELLCAIATSRGGICLNPGDYSRKEKLLWQCSNGHQWGATWTSVQQGRWCSTCAWGKLSNSFLLPAEPLIARAAKMEGFCLNPEIYDGNTRKLHWRCKVGHDWEATWASVQQGHWCPRCARVARADQQRDSMELIHETAALLGGRLVDPGGYKNSNIPVAWECAAGHTWNARWSDVKRGRWCSTCKRAARKGD